MRVKLNDTEIVKTVQCAGNRIRDRMIATHHHGHCALIKDLADGCRNAVKSLAVFHRMHVNVTAVNDGNRSFQILRLAFRIPETGRTAAVVAGNLADTAGAEFAA